MCHVGTPFQKHVTKVCMNRPLIITTGITIVLLTLGVWIYLMLFGTPDDTSEVFTNLGFNPSQQETTVAPPEDSAPIENLVDTTTGVLRQLTTRAVAGYVPVTAASGTAMVRYAEQGTGHVYEINLETGEESIISLTTIPQTSAATFSDDGLSVALTSYVDYQTNVIVGKIADSKLTTTTLEPGADNVVFVNNHTVRYTVVANGATIGYQQDIDTQSRTTLFTFNYVNLLVGWGVDLPTIYLATKPSESQLGHLYTITNNQVSPAATPAYGLQAIYGGNRIITTSRSGTSYRSSIIFGTSTATLPLVTIPEKCTFDRQSDTTLWCGAEYSSPTSPAIDEWYRGDLQFSDVIWKINTDRQSASIVTNPETVTGRTIDIRTVKINTTSTNLFFTDKTDNTLWLLDLTQI